AAADLATTSENPLETSRSERQFRLPLGVPAGRRLADAARRAGETPADARGVSGILTHHDLEGATGTVGAGQENAVFQVHPVVAGLERPDLPARQHQHHAAGIR